MYERLYIDGKRYKVLWAKSQLDVDEIGKKKKKK